MKNGSTVRNTIIAGLLLVGYLCLISVAGSLISESTASHFSFIDAIVANRNFIIASLSLIIIFDGILFFKNKLRK